MKTHLKSYTPAYRAWSLMLNRCRNKNDKRWMQYGGRGIKVCDRWYKFENFDADMGPRPDRKTLDRIDSNGHYEPKNCRWATQKEQQNNRRNNHRITFDGITHTIAEWADETGIPMRTLWARIRNYKWPLERALTEPVGAYYPNTQRFMQKALNG